MAIKKYRSPATEYDDIPAHPPENVDVPPDADVDAIGKATIDKLNNLRKEDLVDFATWRDIISLTDDIRTFSSSDLVFGTFQKLSERKKRGEIKIAGPRPHRAGPPPPLRCGWLDIHFTYTAQDYDLESNNGGIVSVIPDPATGDWKIWLIRTWLENYEGHGHPDKLEPVASNGYTNGVVNGSDSEPYGCLIVGGGQAGLGLGGRLKALRISYRIFDEQEEVGDSWARRYEYLKWHTNRDYGVLPFGKTFPPTDPELMPMDRIAVGYKKWVKTYGINVQQGTHVDNASWDDASQLWTVHTSGVNGSEVWKAKNLVLTIGTMTKSPYAPKWASENNIKASGFKGTITHSYTFKNAAEFAGKRGVVVGTGNTGGDIAEDLATHNMAVTMVQREKTIIIPGQVVLNMNAHMYNPTSNTEFHDLEEMTMPKKIERDLISRAMTKLIFPNFAEHFAALEKAGFMVDHTDDPWGTITKRAGGHYVDVGCCDRIIKGQVKVKQGLVKHLTPDGLLFEDGTEIKADLIVLATGFVNDFRKETREILGDVADQIDDVWQLDSEGETRGYCRPAGHPHLIVLGGDTRMARFYGKFVSLQVQRQAMNRPLRPYTEGRGCVITEV